MKFILGKREYNTDTATLLCKWEDEFLMGDLFDKVPEDHCIYGTDKKNLFLVSSSVDKARAKLLDDEEAQKLFDAHCEGIVYDAYTQYFEVAEG